MNSKEYKKIKFILKEINTGLDILSYEVNRIESYIDSYLTHNYSNKNLHLYDFHHLNIIQIRLLHYLFLGCQRNGSNITDQITIEQIKNELKISEAIIRAYLNRMKEKNIIREFSFYKGEVYQFEIPKEYFSILQKNEISSVKELQDLVEEELKRSYMDEIIEQYDI